MPVLSLQGVLLNGNAPAAGVQPLAPAQQTVRWPVGESGTLNLSVVDPAGAAVNLTGGSLILAVRHLPSDAAPIVARAGVITSASLGKVTFTFVPVDTRGLDATNYRYDVWYTDAAGNKWQLVPASDFLLLESDLQPTDPITVPTTVVPPGIAQVTSTDPALGAMTALGIVTLTQNIIASWPLGAANRRVFMVDPSGSDLNPGYVDGSASFPISSATVAARAKQTVAGLGAVLPRVGAGRHVEVIVRAGTYTDGIDTLLGGISGYAIGPGCVLRGTDTNATAGATAFAGDTADITYVGGTTAAGCNAAGYNPTGAPTTSVIQCLKVGGGAAALPAQPLAPVGWRIRFDNSPGTTTQAALRNVCRAVVIVSGGDTVTTLTALPAVPTSSDIFYLEWAGVGIAGGNFAAGPQGGSGTVVGLQLVGIRLTSNTIIVGSTLAFAFSGVTGSATLKCNCGTFVRQNYVHPSGTITVGGGLHVSGSYFHDRGGWIDAHCMVTETTVVVDELSFANWKNGSIAGTGLSVYGISGTDAPTVTSIGSATGETGHFRCQILGSNSTSGAGLVINNSKINLGSIDITGCGARPAIAMNASQVTQLVSAGITGTTGNSDVGLSLLAQGFNIWSINGNTNTVTGSSGDVRLGGSQVLTWSALSTTGLRDTKYSVVVGNAPPLAPGGYFAGKLASSGGGAVFTYCGCSDAPTQNNPTAPGFPQSLRIFRRLRVRIVSGVLGVTTTFTLYRNGVATTITCTIAAAGTTAVDDVHQELFADGDALDLRADAPLDGTPGTILFSAAPEYAA